MTSFVFSAMSMISTFHTSSPVTSPIVTFVVGRALHTLSPFTGSSGGTVIVGSTVDTHFLVATDLSVFTVSAVLTSDANVFLADPPVMTISVVGAFNTFLLVANAVAIVVGVAKVRFHLVATWTGAHGHDFWLDGS